MNDYRKAKRSILGVIIGLFVFAVMCVPAHAVLFGCCNCCEEELTSEELTEKIAEVNHHFGRYKISIEEAREICPQAVKSELERRFMAYGSKLEIYLLSDVAHFYILHAHSMLDLDKHCVYFIMGPDKYAYQEIPPDSYEVVSSSGEEAASNFGEEVAQERCKSTSSTATTTSRRRLFSCSSVSPSISETEDDMFVSSKNLAHLKLFVPSAPRASSHLCSHSFPLPFPHSSLANPPFSLPTEPDPSSPTSPKSLCLPRPSSSPASLAPSCARLTLPQPLPSFGQHLLSRSPASSSAERRPSLPIETRHSPSSSLSSSSSRRLMSPNPLAERPPIRVRMKLPEHQKIDLCGFTWNPPFGNINPLEGLIILCGDTDLVNKTCNGNLESSFWGPVGAGGLIYTEHNHSWVRPGDLITTADKFIKGAERMRKKLKKRFNLPDLLRTGGKIAAMI